MPFIITTRDELMHSAKGSTWKDHKYIKKIGDKYIYATTKGKAENAAKRGVSTINATNDKGKKGTQPAGYKIADKASSVYSDKLHDKVKEEEKEKKKSDYAKKVAANNAAASALSKVGKTSGAKDTGKKKSTSNANKKNDKKSKAAQTVNDLINKAVAAEKKKKKKK